MKWTEEEKRERHRLDMRRAFPADPEKFRERARVWRAANREHVRVQARARNARPDVKEQARLKARKWYAANRERAIAWAAGWRTKNPEKYQAQRRFGVTRKYGLPRDAYNQMLVAQGGVCLICNRTNGRVDLAVDHDHKTGDVRGLLCSPCNLALGCVNDSIERLDALIVYLARSRRPKLRSVA